jgi:hypothetical protein
VELDAELLLGAPPGPPELLLEPEPEVLLVPDPPEPPEPLLDPEPEPVLDPAALADVVLDVDPVDPEVPLELGAPPDPEPPPELVPLCPPEPLGVEPPGLTESPATLLQLARPKTVPIASAPNPNR